MLFLAVWWLWIFTSWVTNWLDPRQDAGAPRPVRADAGRARALASIPHAFESMGLAFALAHAGSQVRTLPVHDPGAGPGQPRQPAQFPTHHRLAARGGCVLDRRRPRRAGAAPRALGRGARHRICRPSAGFAVPGLGRSTTADWDVEGHHLSERCSLFVIIALGESILVTGATFADLAWGPAQVAAFLAALVGSIAMWWIYFDTGAERGSHHIAASDDPGRLARLGYTYLHGLIIAGIIVRAVADELALVHLDGHEGHIDFASAARSSAGRRSISSATPCSRRR